MGDIVYTDSGSVGAQYRLRINGTNLELLRDGVVVNSQPLASVDSVTISAGSGNDTLLIDELISLSGGVTFNGGAQSGPPGDAIIVQAGALSSAEVTYTNATDGRMVFADGTTTAVYNFTGIDPLDMTGSTPDRSRVQLPGGTDTQLEDDGTSGNAISQLRDADASPGFDTTTFAHPTGSLTDQRHRHRQRQRQSRR